MKTSPRRTAGSGRFHRTTSRCRWARSRSSSTAPPGVLARIGDFRVNCFGHLGDGNLHYNVFPQPGRTRADHLDDRDAIKRGIHDLVHAMDGSVSAEHGIGRLKVDDLERYADPAKLAVMRTIKAALDPAGILNPGAVLRE